MGKVSNDKETELLLLTTTIHCQFYEPIKSCHIKLLTFAEN